MNVTKNIDKIKIIEIYFRKDVPGGAWQIKHEKLPENDATWANMLMALIEGFAESKMNTSGMVKNVTVENVAKYLNEYIQALLKGEVKEEKCN